MISAHARVKLIDFGLCRDVSQAPGCTMIGSPFFMPPESAFFRSQNVIGHSHFITVIKYETHSTPADIYSSGVMFVEALIGHTPNHGSAVRAMYLAATVGIDVDQFTGLSASARDFVRKCLHRKQQKRASAAALLEDDFIKSACNKTEAVHMLRTMFGNFFTKIFCCCC